MGVPGAKTFDERIADAIEKRLDEIGHGVRDVVEAIQQADRGRNDALSVVGSLKAAIQMQDVEIQRLLERVELNDQAVQSCLSTLGELNKLVQVIASKIPA